MDKIVGYMTLWILNIQIIIVLVYLTPTILCETTSSPSEDVEHICSSIGTCNAENSTMCMCSQFATGPDCECSIYFTGLRCNTLDLRQPIKDVFERGIRFQWLEEVCLDDHAVIFTRTPAKKNSNVRIQELVSNWTKEIEVDGMAPDAREYILCIFHNEELSNVSENQMYTLFNRTLPNCGVLVTAFAEDGAFSLAFTGITIAMGVVVFALLVARAIERCKNKQTREQILADVLGGLNKFRYPSKKTVNSSGENNGGFTTIPNETYTTDESFDEVDKTYR